MTKFQTILLVVTILSIVFVISALIIADLTARLFILAYGVFIIKCIININNNDNIKLIN